LQSHFSPTPFKWFNDLLQHTCGAGQRLSVSPFTPTATFTPV
jgi:hypothetical protein